MWAFRFALFATVLAGCGKGVKEADLVGVWTGRAEMTYEAMKDDASGESEQATFLADQVGEGKSIRLELQSGGKAVFELDGQIEGTWRLSGDSVTLTLPDRQSSTAGPGFSGTYVLKLGGAGEMTGPDPVVKGFTLTFRK
jgi:hypothetical protein